MRLGLTFVALLGLGGCSAYDDGASGSPTEDFIDMDTPPGNCSAGTGLMPCPDPGDTGVPEGGACRESSDCANGNACTAPFVNGEVGEFTCTSQCIALDDESSWCLDATACCDPGAVCSARGLCVAGGLDDSGTASDTGSGTAGTGADGSGTGGASSGSGTAGSGSDTGASSGSSGSTGAG